VEESIPLITNSEPSSLIGGRLSIDFANKLGRSSDFSWSELLHFLLITRIISAERSSQLLTLPQYDPQSADALLARAQRLHSALSEAFLAMVEDATATTGWAEPINEVLRITEGHDELVQQGGSWHLDFVARESGLDWLLAAIARSGAELIAEGVGAPLRVCSNAACGLFFYDTSRTGRRRWCSMATCGNRHKVAAFSRRHTAGRRPH
jgi:predicted RNA-binding Zn ribbon-like protein